MSPDQPPATEVQDFKLPFGAAPCGGGLVGFRIWAPDAAAAQIALADAAPVPMHSVGGGWFEGQARTAAGAQYQYLLTLPNMAEPLAVPDPASRAQAGDVHGHSVVVDPAAYHWQCQDWRGRPWHEAVVYELHVGAMGGFKAVTARLQALAQLGVTAVELMPIAEFPGDRNWGYDGVLAFAPEASYGTPAELKQLIDTAHQLDMMVFLDVVYNHFGPDGNYIGAYASGFYRHDLKTPWGDSIDFRRPEVRQFFTQNAIYWLDEYRFDGLRFDAVHMIRDPEFLRALAAAIRTAIPADRRVHLVIENEENAADLLRVGPDAPGFDAQWDDDMHHCMHVLLTGESEAYYEDFQDDPAGKLARCLAEGFAYQGEPSPHAGGTPRGQPSSQLPSTAFVVCLQNHDQIGNRAMGERLTVLADPDGLRAAVALLLLCPHIPMIFMGEEWGSRSPFLFFTAHNDELAELVRQGRRREFAKFAAFTDPARRELIPDPNAVATFEASRPDAVPPGADAEAYRALYTQLLQLRAADVAPRIPGTMSLAAEAIGAKAVRASWRMGDGATLTIASNLGPAPVRCGPLEGRIVFASAGFSGGDLPAHTTVVTLRDAAP